MKANDFTDMWNALLNAAPLHGVDDRMLLSRHCSSFRMLSELLLNRLNVSRARSAWCTKAELNDGVDSENTPEVLTIPASRIASFSQPAADDINFWSPIF
jgi:hypothetical protein